MEQKVFSQHTAFFRILSGKQQKGKTGIILVLTLSFTSNTSCISCSNFLGRALRCLSGTHRLNPTKYRGTFFSLVYADTLQKEWVVYRRYKGKFRFIRFSLVACVPQSKTPGHLQNKWWKGALKPLLCILVSYASVPTGISYTPIAVPLLKLGKHIVTTHLLVAPTLVT